jgi:hypothetical protein
LFFFASVRIRPFCGAGTGTASPAFRLVDLHAPPLPFLPTATSSLLTTAPPAQPRGSPVVFPGAARFLKVLCIPDSAHSAYSSLPRPRLPPPVPPSRVFRKKKLSPLESSWEFGSWLSNRESIAIAGYERP